jgi:hypothetical protein
MKKVPLSPQDRYTFRVWRRGAKKNGRHLDRRVKRVISRNNTTLFFVTPSDGTYGWSYAA